MALIKCFECGNEISDTAVVCPKCGIALKKENSNSVSKKNTGHTVLNVFAIIFIALYSIFCIYSIYTNASGFIENIDYIEFVDVTYYLNWIMYYIGTCLALWMMFAYNVTEKKVFKILSGIVILVSVLFAFLYYVVGLFTWADDIEYFFELVGSILQLFFGYYGAIIACYLMLINRKKNN